jgi:hypothetical protein
MAATLTQTDSTEGVHIGDGTKLFKKVLTFDAGNPAADLAATVVGTQLSGFLSAVRVLFGTTAPDTVTITLTGADGHTIATGTLTASGSLDLNGETPVFVNGLSIAIAGNSTNSATAVISLIYFT